MVKSPPGPGTERDPTTKPGSAEETLLAQKREDLRYIPPEWLAQFDPLALARVFLIWRLKAHLSKRVEAHQRKAWESEDQLNKVYEIYAPEFRRPLPEDMILYVQKRTAEKMDKDIERGTAVPISQLIEDQQRLKRRLGEARYRGKVKKVERRKRRGPRPKVRKVVMMEFFFSQEYLWETALKRLRGEDVAKRVAPEKEEEERRRYLIGRFLVGEIEDTQEEEWVGSGSSYERWIVELGSEYGVAPAFFNRRLGPGRRREYWEKARDRACGWEGDGAPRKFLPTAQELARVETANRFGIEPHTVLELIRRL